MEGHSTEDGVRVKAALHPDLATDVRRNRWIGTPFMLCIAVGLSVHGFRLLALGGSDGARWAEPSLSFAISVLFWWAAAYVWLQTRWYRRASWVLASVAPIEVRVEVGRNERGWSTLRLERADGGSGCWHLICRGRDDGAGLDGQALLAHVDPRPGGPIVLVAAQRRIWSLPGTPTRYVAGEGARRPQVAGEAQR